jgi:hypothetical protein
MQLFICDEAVSASLLYSVKLTVESNISAYLPSNHIICRRIRFRLTVHCISKVTSVSSVTARLLIEFVDKLYRAIKLSSLCSSGCFLFGTGVTLHVICLQSELGFFTRLSRCNHTVGETALILSQQEIGDRFWSDRTHMNRDAVGNRLAASAEMLCGSPSLH